MPSGAIIVIASRDHCAIKSNAERMGRTGSYSHYAAPSSYVALPATIVAGR